MKNKIAIATMTWDKKGDPDIVKSALEVLAGHEYPVYVADAGSSDGFVDYLKKLGHFVKNVPGSLTFQQKDAILEASKSSDFVLYVEPDKYDWFKEGLEKTIDAYFSGENGFAAVSRTSEQLKTFPKCQQEWEKKMNDIVAKETGVEGDFIYGPKLFQSRLGYEVGEIKEDIGWGIVLFLVGRAHKLGMPIKTLFTASECPLNRRLENNEKYREKQFNDNKNGFYLGLN